MEVGQVYFDDCEKEKEPVMSKCVLFINGIPTSVKPHDSLDTVILDIVNRLKALEDDN